MEYSSNILEYNSFIADQLLEEAKMERYIKECILIGSNRNTIKNMGILNESVGDKIKEGFKKIMEAIARMWGKFVEAVNNLVRNNRSYLEKYKDIILKKKLREAKYTMYDYNKGLERILQTPVPVFNYESMQADLVDQETFIEKNFKMIPKSESTFSDRCKAYFRGSDDVIPIPSSQLNMTNIFNYCYDYEAKMKPKIEEDLNKIKKAANDIADMIDRADKEQKSQATSTNTNESYLNKKYYSFVYEEYIEELEIDYGTSSNGGSENSPGKNMKNMQGENPKKDDQSVAVKSDASSYEDKIKKAQNYLNVCGGALAAKQTVSEQIFKEYMQIIKAHVRDNVGTSKDTTNDKVEDPGTNYKSVVDKVFSNNGKPEDSK